MKKLLLAATIFAAVNAYAQTPEIQITATRVAVPVDHVGDDVDIITKEQIRKYGFTSIADVLKYVAGITESSNGGFGQTTSVYMLGLPTKYILVMIGGVPVNDPSTIDTQANFAYIDLNNVERIEVLKGPQAALYGSEAIAGVINIITKKPKKNEFKVGLEGGKYKTFKEDLYSALKLKDGYLSLSFENFKTNGFSASNEKAGSGTYDPDNDGYNYRTGWLSWGWDLNDSTKLTGNIKLKGGKVEYDSANNGVPVPDAHTSYNNFFTSLKIESALSNNLLLTAKFGNNKEERFSIDTGIGNYTGITRYASFQITNYFGSSFVNFGTSYKQEIGRCISDYPAWSFTTTSVANLHTRSIYGEFHSDLNASHFTFALRRDFHSQFGAKTTYKVSASYDVKTTETTLKVQYGTGFRAPSVYQLYARGAFFGIYEVIGNPNLKPETSEGWILGVAQRMPFVKGRIEINYFKNHVWNPIVYESSANPNYQNASNGLSEGAEIKLSISPIKNFSLWGTYTHQHVDGDDDFTLRRPEIIYIMGSDYLFGKTKFSFWIEHYSARADKDYSSSPAKIVSLSPFTTYNCYLSYKLNDKVKFHIKGINLTNKKYELAYGYNTMGRAAFAGIDISF
jgi:vitamin B12 transporter